MSDRFVALLIMDGWGIHPGTQANAVRQARTPNVSALEKTYPYTQLTAHGNAVGLPKGVMGNSEVGHLNLGAGRVVWQEITRIDKAIEDGDFFSNPAFLGAVEHVRKTGGALHLMGLVSTGRVHSSEEHYFALVELARRQKLPKVFVHVFTDGRDTPPQSGLEFVAALEKKLEGVGRIATVSGRYFAMDRDQRWERTKKAYDCLTAGQGLKAASASQAVEAAYGRGETDEFISPTCILDEGVIRSGDAVIFFNYRADRTRQITRALMEKEFKGFERLATPDVHFVMMTPYQEEWSYPTAFHPTSLKNVLGKVLAENKLPQLRIAETEKYAHVTYFFNGGEEEPFAGEERILVPSPKVATYDLQPEMSAAEVTAKALVAIRSGKYRAMILNYANPDMVGHTGSLPAAIKAVETVDDGVGQLTRLILQQGGAAIVTADHGNCEQLIDDEGRPHTYHTTNPVPCTLVCDEFKNATLRSGGSLRDIAPTMLDLLGVTAPAEMDGRSLLIRG